MEHLVLLSLMKSTSMMLGLKNFYNNRAKGATKGTVIYTKLAASCWSYEKEDKTLLGVVQLTGGGPNREL